jgi:hypothetical protein
MGYDDVVSDFGGGTHMKDGRQRAVRSMLVVILLGVTLGAAFAGCALAPAGTDDSRVAAVGRITDLDPGHGFAIVEFPTGRMFVTIEKRDMGKYIVGDELRIDSYGRPLPPLPRARG